MTKQESIKIQAEPRKSGKHWSRSLRNERKIPAIIYGPHIENLNISVTEVEAQKYSSSNFDNSIFTLQSADKNIDGIKVLKKDIVVHPASHRPLHIDFYAIDMTSVVRVYVKLKFTGKALGMTEGGILQEIRHDVEVECLPGEIPPYFEVDITELNLGDVLHVSDMKIPPNIKVITGLNEAIVTVAEPQEEEPTPVAAAPEEGVAATPGAPGATGAPAAGAAPTGTPGAKPEASKK